ncbi:MAG: hypothetical protein ACREOW_17635 [Thermodesulfobacteriota bacterium]
MDKESVDKKEETQKENYERPQIKTYTEKDILEKFEVSALTF